MFDTATAPDLRSLPALFLLAFLAAATPATALLAQGLDDTGAVETIIGSDVEVEESQAGTEAVAVIAAIANTSASITEVRKRFTLDNLEIVFLGEVDDGASRIGQEIERRRDEIAELHKAIEGNPMFYLAAESRSLMVRDIVALAFDANGVTIYAAGEAPEG